MSKIAIVGCGLVGRSWAISFARAGHQVWLWDRLDGQAQAAIGDIQVAAPELHANGLLGGSSIADMTSRLHAAATAAEALEGASYVQESTAEDLTTKQAVFAMLDGIAAPSVVLASSTSAILPSKFSEGLPGAGRCLVAHPINPPHLVPAVEIVPAPWTGTESIQFTHDLMRQIGQSPIVMTRELDGFLINRLQSALLQEAFRLVAEDYASVEDIDICIRDGLALRWSFMGPFETIDLNAPAGVRDYVGRYGAAFAQMAQDAAPIPWTGPLLDKVEDQRRQRLPFAALADRQKWRDRQLMALAVHKAKVLQDSH
jgi:3-hydroxyacyl-CoA dehydrogenase